MLTAILTNKNNLSIITVALLTSTIINNTMMANNSSNNTNPTLMSKSNFSILITFQNSQQDNQYQQNMGDYQNTGPSQDYLKQQ